MPDNVRRKWERVTQGGASAAGGDSSCCCGCVCVDPNLQHPGGFLTVRDWVVRLDNPTEWARASNDNGDIRVKAGDYAISWDDANARWEAALSTSHVDWRNDNGDISVPSTVTGEVYMDWVSASDPVLVRFDFDATGDIFVPAP